ncbi:hypothetical protein GMRT_14397 [Giardia muris]|uniref:Spindle pole protein n=1 Tax=Giardia muris TaxID=5742 RepID=A0A4Z1STC4_GIAMU|nr:hypothetical protein GMRT_14397 [Giardia muris]|eukprot:TNJ28245.1 hypothetical protein GMRT_14397 [Giardia muris]
MHQNRGAKYQAQTADDFSDHDLHCAALEKPPSMENYVETAIGSLLSELERSFRDSEVDIKTAINDHPFYIMFEPALGCDARTDHTTPKSVYPIFAEDIADILSSLQAKIASLIQPTVRRLIGSRESLIFDSFTTKMAGVVSKECDMFSMEKELAALRITVKELTAQKDEIRETLSKEIHMLREQLFHKKTRVGQMYRPDFGPSSTLEPAAGYSMHGGLGQGPTQADLDNAVRDVTERFTDERKKLDSKYRAELQSAETQTMRLTAELDSLKARYDQLEQEMDSLRLRYDDDIGKQKAYYEDQMEYLNAQVGSAAEASRASIAAYENEITNRDRDITRLSAELRESLEREDKAKSQLSQLKRSHKEELDELRAKHNEELDAQRAELMEQVRRAQEEAHALLTKNSDDKLAEMLSKLNDYEERNRTLEENYRAAKREMDTALSALQAQHQQELEALQAEYHSNTMVSEVSTAVEDAEREFKSVLRCIEYIFSRLFDDRRGAMTKMLVTKEFDPNDYVESRRTAKLDTSTVSESDTSLLNTEPTVRIGGGLGNGNDDSMADLNQSVFSERSVTHTSIPTNYLYRSVEKMINQQRLGKMANKHLSKPLKMLLNWSKMYANSKLTSTFGGDFASSHLSFSTDSSMTEGGRTRKKLDLTGAAKLNDRAPDAPVDSLLQGRPPPTDSGLVLRRESSVTIRERSASMKSRNAKGKTRGKKSALSSDTSSVLDDGEGDTGDEYGTYANMPARQFADEFFNDGFGQPQLNVVNSVVLNDKQILGERSPSMCGRPDALGAQGEIVRLSEHGPDTVRRPSSMTIHTQEQGASDIYGGMSARQMLAAAGRTSSSTESGEPRFYDIGVNTEVCTTAVDNAYFLNNGGAVLMRSSVQYACDDCLAIKNGLASGHQTPQGLSQVGTKLSGTYSGSFGAGAIKTSGSVNRLDSAKSGDSISSKKRSNMALTPIGVGKGLEKSPQEMEDELNSLLDYTDNGGAIQDDESGFRQIATGISGPTCVTCATSPCPHTHPDGIEIVVDEENREFVCPYCGNKIPFDLLAKYFIPQCGPPRFIYDKAPAAVPLYRRSEPVGPNSYLSERRIYGSGDKKGQHERPVTTLTTIGQDLPERQPRGYRHTGAHGPGLEGRGPTQFTDFDHVQLKLPSYPPFRPGARSGSHTQPEMDGVFTRILQRAELIRVRYLRKRELILQERKRTTERILRALSLLNETFTPPAQAKARADTQKSVFAATPPIARHLSATAQAERVSPVARRPHTSGVGNSGQQPGSGPTSANVQPRSSLRSAPRKPPFEYAQYYDIPSRAPVDHVAKAKQTIANSNKTNHEVLHRIMGPGREHRGQSAYHPEQHHPNTGRGTSAYRPRSAYPSFPANALAERPGSSARTRTTQLKTPNRTGNVFDVLNAAGMVRRQ